MRALLVGPELEENLGLRYLDAAIRGAGHSCSIIPFDRSSDLGRVARVILHRRPHLVGLSLVAQRRYADCQSLVTTLRRRGFAGHVTAGGHFAGLRATEILRDTPGLDSVIHHDGERRIVGVLALLERGGYLPGDLDGVSWRTGDGVLCHVPPRTAIDLDGLALPTRRSPDWTLGYPRAPLVAGRGCAGSCTFCSIHAWHRAAPGRRLRFRSPASVVEEMVRLHQDRGVRVFVFHDDDFLHPDPRRALDRCRALFDSAQRRIGRPFAFVLKSRPDRIDEEIFAYLKSVGLARVYIGIESHARSGLDALGRRVTPEVNSRALAVLRRLGVYSCFNLLIFHPETTPDELEENLAFLEAHREHPFDVARTELYAASTLETRMLSQGRALGDYRGYDYRIADPRTERIFQLWADALWERHFGAASILHRSQELGFRLSLLARLEPALASSELEARVNALVREVNSDTIDYLRRLIEASARRACGVEFVEALRREIRSRVRAQSMRWAALELELECRAALGRAGLGRFPATDGWPRLVGRLASAAPLVALLLGSSGCKDQVCDPPPPPSRFTQDIEPGLDTFCATPGCHSSTDKAAGLDLTSGASYDNLVGKPSTQLPAMLLVKPGDPDSSYLQQKLDGTQASVGGQGEMMVDPDSELPSRVRRWIEEGADRD